MEKSRTTEVERVFHRIFKDRLRSWISHEARQSCASQWIFHRALEIIEGTKIDSGPYFIQWLKASGRCGTAWRQPGEIKTADKFATKFPERSGRIKDVTYRRVTVLRCSLKVIYPGTFFPPCLLRACVYVSFSFFFFFVAHPQIDMFFFGIGARTSTAIQSTYLVLSPGTNQP